MQNHDVVGSFVRANPHESMKIAALAVLFIWQSVPALLGLGFYLGFKQFSTKPLQYLLPMGILLAAACLLLQLYLMGSYSVADYFSYGWAINQSTWGFLFQGDGIQATFIVLYMGFNYTIGLPLILASLLIAIDSIPMSSHKKTLNALQRGRQLRDEDEISSKEIEQSLNELACQNDQGTVLGVSKLNGDPVTIADHAVNQVVLVLGTTGGGKTITLRRFIDHAAYKQYPLIIVDGKPSEDNVSWVKLLAEKRNQPFYGFNCGNFYHYDPLTNGGYTELKDKIISLKDQWESDYYRSIAEDYLQTTFEILLKRKKPFDLSTIAECLDCDVLIDYAREADDQTLMDRLDYLEKYDRKDITGLQAHLNLLINSELGEYFKVNETTFNLAQAIDQNAVIYFALPALRFPTFSKVLGKLVVNDIKAVIDRYQGEKKIFTIFDEFSVFASEQVLNLVNMGRGKGVHPIFGTQGLADLEKVDTTFKDQILNCANTLICHRLNDQNSAESVANWVGTKDMFTITAQLNMRQKEAGLGTVRQNKEFIVHPDAIKQGLNTGEAYLVTKVNGFRKDKVVIKYTN